MLDLSRLPMVVESGVVGTMRERTVAVNDRIAAVVARHRLIAVDLFGWSGDAEMESRLVSPDGFHPSDRGARNAPDATKAARTVQ